ncbi:DUF6401 family natural product biosynthesis protein [Amycolatopsis minnesotensis]|uniref:Uncharacterized protein n=1 Tax=Amycolatopsis minnesotensis TaxID=337894 RepID=A0ABP5C1B1_9PSEU
MHWIDRLTDRSARRWLCGMGARVESGWVALGTCPDLRLAFGTQLHAVADAVHVELDLSGRAEPLTPLALIAGHAHDVWTAATRAGWQPPAVPSAWARHEPTGLRLLACYWLAATLPHGPKVPPVVPEPVRASPDLRHLIGSE